MTWKISVCRMTGQPVETDLDHDENVVCDECSGELEWVEVVRADVAGALAEAVEASLRPIEARPQAARDSILSQALARFREAAGAEG